MKAFPMFIRTSGRRVVILGGGEQAAQKARLIGKTDATLVIAAPVLCEELMALVRSRRAAHHDGPVTVALFSDAVMGFIATGCPATDACLHAIAQAARCPVNVVDQPALCDLTTPSIVDRDPVVVAIGTEGTGPVLARQIKAQLETQLPSNLGALAELAGHLRARVARHIPRAARRPFWRWVFAGAPRQAWDRQHEEDGRQKIERAIAAHGAPDERAEGCLALVGVQPGAHDLLTLRAVQRLQEADTIYMDQDVGAAVLELGRRDADRVVLPSEARTAWRQSRVIAEVRRGNRVVHLTAGAPSVALRSAYLAAEIAVEDLPGALVAAGMDAQAAQA